MGLIRKTSSTESKELFGHMGILTSAETSANAVEWYAGLPSTLGLDQVLRRPIALPWDTRLARENDAAGASADHSVFDMVSNSSDNSSPEAWRLLNGLPLLLWHVRFGLAGGDAASAVDFLHWLACIVQRRARCGARGPLDRGSGRVWQEPLRQQRAG